MRCWSRLSLYCAPTYGLQIAGHLILWPNRFARSALVLRLTAHWLIPQPEPLRAPESTPQPHTALATTRNVTRVTCCLGVARVEDTHFARLWFCGLVNILYLYIWYGAHNARRGCFLPHTQLRSAPMEYCGMSQVAGGSSGCLTSGWCNVEGPA